MSDSGGAGVELGDEACQQLIDEFVRLTDTNSAEAQMYLQDRDWSLERSVNDYFENWQKETGGHSQEVVEVSDGGDEGGSAAPLGRVKRKIEKEPEVVDLCSQSKKSPCPTQVLKFITWNIDGLDGKNLLLRTRAACKIIKELEADVVFLQEVIPTSEKILRGELLKEYEFFSGDSMGSEFGDKNYYTLTMVRKGDIEIDDSEVINFPDSVMMRNLTKTRIRVNGSVNKLSITLLNTHMESTKEHSRTRVRQLRQSFEISDKIPKDEAIILAGDLNMRDAELESIGGLPKDFIDAWESTGRRPECQYTWDMTRNDNLDTNWGKFRPKCRFDRIFYRDSKPSRAYPLNFGLVGLQRLKPHVCFPSDHWGILCQFKVI